MVLFIHQGFSTFIKKDYDLLKKHFEILDFYYPPSKKFGASFQNQFKLFLWLLTHINKANTIFVWFADYHSLLPILFSKIYGKKSLLVVAGYDVAAIPELNYGSFSKPIRAFFAAYAIKYSNFLLPVDQSLAILAKERVKNIKGKIAVIPFGFDASYWFSNSQKEKTVLTVAMIDNFQRIKIKGIDFFTRVAAKLPDYHFMLIGITDHAQKLLDCPNNVELIGKLPLDQLREYYSRAKVYAQFSLSEGLPNVICEAMLCECIPVGSGVGGIPTSIGDCGFILEERDVDKAVELVRKAMNAPASLAKKARQRIIEFFTPEQREEKICALIVAD